MNYEDKSKLRRRCCDLGMNHHHHHIVEEKVSLLIPKRYPLMSIIFERYYCVRTPLRTSWKQFSFSTYGMQRGRKGERGKED